MDRYKLYINGKWTETGNWDTVTDKYTGEPYAEVALAGNAELDAACAAAGRSFAQTRALSAFQRAEILDAISSELKRRAEEIARVIAVEGGKTWKYALGEAARAHETFTFAAGIARTLHGETVPMDASSRGGDYFGMWIREPVGVVGAITPFNFPLNLVAHKVAPAIAAGCPIVLKPAGTTPITALKLAEIIEQTEWPDGAFNVIHGSGRTIGMGLVQDPRVAKLTFTGSVEVGKTIKQHSGLKRVTLELGNNSPVVVDETADIAHAVSQCVMGAFSHGGQVCISVQRIYVHDSVADEFIDQFVKQTQALKIGHPLDQDADVSGLISVMETDRVELWVKEAVADGAKVLTGGKRIGKRVYQPTVLINTRKEMKVWSDEIFGPVVLIEPVSTFDEGLKLADDTRFGLQAGVFTSRIDQMFASIRELNFGGIMVNEVPTFRVDQMPYGGNRNSGIGREGLRFAVDEMTNIKMVAVRV
ncbi:glutarate-semialdehyde dehydrogenase DavD [bacterium BMS3Bbin04]|nr:glutarate-semialdehyde dehydrogenase DavD [bacterium BMS3Bbin04]